MPIYFIPHTASSPCVTSLLFWYASMVFAVVVLFIYGIAESDTFYVAISVIIILGTTIFGCMFSRVFDYCRRVRDSEKNNYHTDV